MKANKLINLYIFEKILDTLVYGLEFQRGFVEENDSAYTLGTLEGTAHIVSCQIVQWFGLFKDPNFQGIGACDIMEFMNLKSFPSRKKLGKKLKELLKEYEIDLT